MAQTYVALDLETTGLKPERDVIIEIGAVKFRGDDIIDTFSSLVNPRRPLASKIIHLTGITNEDLQYAPTLFRVAKDLTNFVGQYPVIGHNVPFDLRFLNKQGLLISQPSIDTFELASILLPEASRYSLSTLTELLGIKQDIHHRALHDAQATRELFLRLRERGMSLDLGVVRELNRLAARTTWALRGFFRDIEQERARTVFVSAPQPEERKRRPPTSGGIFEQEPAKALQPAATRKVVDVDMLTELLSPDGLLGQGFPGYEFRPQQIEMLQAVTEAFNVSDHVLVEAGTGTGKSLAYLLPAIYFAYLNGQRVVISTNTINLQDQLYGKDIPDLVELLPIEFKAALLKGRSNYVCMRRLLAFRRRGDLSVDEIRVLAKILTWLSETSTGDKAEVMLLRDEQSIWRHVQAEAETCLADRCPYRVRGECFLYQARNQAESAHVIIVNHALLLSDIVTENRVLPEFDHLIIDEAHHLEEQATSHLGFSVSQGQVLSLLKEISNPLGAQRQAGFLSEIMAHFQHSQVPGDVQVQIAESLKGLHALVRQSRQGLDSLFAELAMFLDNLRDQRSSGYGSYDIHLRLTRSLRSQPDWTDVELRWEDFGTPFRRLGRSLEQLHNSLQDMEDMGIERYEEMLQDMLGYRANLQEMDRHIEAILTNPTSDAIYWAQISVQRGTISLNMAPLHVGALLEQQLFHRKETIILTSATLCSDGDFAYIKDRLGLWDANELQVGSPFDYENSTLLFLPTDVPQPGQKFYQRAVERTLIGLCSAIGGRTLVLFTSHSQLLNTYRAINSALEEEDIIIYAQGVDGSRRQILENFKTTPRSVLLGTRSFWEGVDVMGEALSCVVIARLPFAVPSDPVFAARSETFDDPFSQYAVPEAILRFRQGFGRLIRSATDRGVVVIMDNRFLSKFYGERFLRSLPDCTVLQSNVRDLPAAATRWIDKERGPH